MRNSGIRNSEFALLLVEGVYFRQDIFRQDEQNGTSDPMAASHRIALHHSFVNRQKAAHQPAGQPYTSMYMRTQD
jgi:hypothetical protein